MTIAGRSSAEVANDLGTQAVNVFVFVKLCFDVVGHMNNRGWIAQLCVPAVDRTMTDEEACERRWLSIAYRRGWAGLASVVFPKRPDAVSGKGGQDRLHRLLLSRAGDYMENLERAGVPPSERDLQFLVLLEKRLEALGVPLTLADLDFLEPVHPEDEGDRKEAEKKMKELTREARRKLADFYLRFQDAANSLARSEVNPGG